MSIVALVVGICIIVFALWLVQNYLPAPWKTPLLVIIVILALVWLASLLFPELLTTRVTR